MALRSRRVGEFVDRANGIHPLTGWPLNAGAWRKHVHQAELDAARYVVFVQREGGAVGIVSCGGRTVRDTLAALAASTSSFKRLGTARGGDGLAEALYAWLAPWRIASTWYTPSVLDIVRAVLASRLGVRASEGLGGRQRQRDSRTRIT
jgi:hypothetical protein